MHRLVLAVLTLALAALWMPLASAAAFLSPCAEVMDNNSGLLYVAEATGNAIVAVNPATGEIKGSFALPGSPSGVALALGGKLLCVTIDDPNGSVCFLDPKTGAVTDTLRVGHTPMAPVAAPNSNKVYVCNRFNNSVSIIDLDAKRETGRVSVQREPVAAAILPDGSKLFVANLLPTGPADGDYAGAAISVLDTGAQQVAQQIALPNGSSGVHGICVSPDGKFAYAVHILSRYQLPTTQLERGWMNTNAVTVIDTATCAAVATVLLDDVELGAANPWGVACSPDGQFLCVTHAGTHELSVIDRAAMHTKLDAVKEGKPVSEVASKLEEVANDLAFLTGMRQRIKMLGAGPRAIVFSGAQAIVAEYFSDTLSVVDIKPAVKPAIRAVALGPKPVLTPERQGELFFHDASLCFQQWQSCSSCHPDARVDGFNWDLLNDGIGNPKNTKSMLLSHKTPPVMSLGVREKAEDAVRSGIKFIQFAVRPEADAVAIDEYLKSLKPVPSPVLVNGQWSPEADRGKKIFESAGCSSCHTPGLYTDLKQYDLGTGRNMDKDKPMDTPTLVEVWRTAPYLSYGQAATLFDVFKKFNPGDRHGNTSSLDDGQLNDLVAFVLSL